MRGISRLSAVVLFQLSLTGAGPSAISLPFMQQHELPVTSVNPVRTDTRLFLSRPTHNVGRFFRLAVSLFSPPAVKRLLAAN
jgi:hypothetical protein